MAKVIVMFKTPADPAAFDAHYFNTHVPLARTIPGLRDIEFSAGPVATPAGAAPYHLITTLTFDSMAAIGAAMASAEGRASSADQANFAQAGADILLFETQPS